MLLNSMQLSLHLHTKDTGYVIMSVGKHDMRDVKRYPAGHKDCRNSVNSCISVVHHQLKCTCGPCGYTLLLQMSITMTHNSVHEMLSIRTKILPKTYK